MNTYDDFSDPQFASDSSFERFRRLGVLVGAILIALIGAAGLSLTARAAETPAAPSVPVVTLASRTITDSREILGRVDAVETVEVRPRVSGYIDEVRLQSGQLVKKGDILFLIDPRRYRAQHDLANAGVERAKVRVSVAERDAKRASELSAAQRNAISVEELDARTTRLAEARAELLAAQATLEDAKLNLEYAEVRAPISGRVSRAYVTAGNLVSGAPGGATLLTSIVTVGDAYVYADADEATVLAFNRLAAEGKLVTENGRVPVGMRLSDEEGFPHRGYIESVDNHLDANTGSLTVRMVFPNADGRLVPGLFARVKLPVSAPEPTLLITERAISTDQNRKFVLTVGADNVVVARTVKLGPALDGDRVIREGLKPGDRVIVNGLQHVRPGMTVAVEAEPAPAAAVALK